MTAETNPGHRRIDRVLREDYLSGLPAMDLADVRALRHEAEQEEADVSYIRRLLQGRIDIIRAEMERRARGGDAESLVDVLPRILADERGAPHGLGQHRVVEPSRVDQHRRRVEALIANVDLSDVSGASDEHLVEALEILQSEEREQSDIRHRVQVVVDACAEEITRRYRDGEADVADLLPSEPAGG